MRRLYILKTFVNILFAVSLIGLFFGVPFIFILAVMPERVPFKFNIEGTGHDAEVNAELIIYLLAILIGYGFFTYALYLVRKTLDLFAKKIFLDDRVIKYFDQTGKAILIGYAIVLVSQFFYRFITNNEIHIALDFSINSSVFAVCLGLFFMVLSEVFLIARNRNGQSGTE